MKTKLLLFLKWAAYSTGLFVVWKPIIQVYGFILSLLLSIFQPKYFMHTWSGEYPYFGSLLLVPFIALTIVTPKISVLKKAVTISIMVAMFLVIDCYMVLVARKVLSGAENPVYIAYRSFRLLVLFFTWFMVSYPYVFIEGRTAYSYACPICKNKHADIVAHIREIHGEKSLNKDKVRRLISEHPEITA